MKYKVQWDYKSNIGSFDKDSVVEIDEALAEHLNRDSPGVLKPASSKHKASSKPKASSESSDDETPSESSEESDEESTG
ncbi:MAG: hypothetical protein L0Z63_05760 [Actinobacteria bacterium]|nr:hypothetical protein [Actinomycetota bacterium]